jgi:branched-chain amino acid transport system permease protein
LVSIGNAAFLSIGAVAAAQIAVRHHGPFWLALIVGTLASALAGLLLAIPAARIKGLYLAMATLAFHFIVNSGVLKIQTKQVGPAGYRLPKASLAGFEIRSLRVWYVVLAVSAALTLLLVRTLLVRKPGRAWRAIREEQAMAAMSGVAVWRYKVWAFAVSSGLVGFAGVLSAYYIGVISSETFDLHLAVLYLAYVIIGGMGSMYGPIVGSLFLVSLPHIIEKSRSGLGLGSSDPHIFLIQDAAIGAAVVVMILVEPLGLARLLGRAAGFAGRLFARRRAVAVPEGSAP